MSGSCASSMAPRWSTRPWPRPRTSINKRVLQAGYFGVTESRLVVPTLSRAAARRARASTKRSSIWTMTPRCFCSIGAIGPRRTGGEIFSNVNAGIVHLLTVELRHSWTLPVRLTGDGGHRPVTSTMP
ncbi:hypothetical protein chiPu_0030348 [Chiloscyllium punctatum]|uniref:Uncharacterized protein n=1 Tax=Chiloscyllium punctatum TaxID=137246 RepID=A0A401TUW9_CHIPU|nr:hypothetical protein [Chiloscyllium punctatum]